MTDSIEDCCRQAIGGLGGLLRESLRFACFLDGGVNGSLLRQWRNGNLDLSHWDALDGGACGEARVPLASENVGKIVGIQLRVIDDPNAGDAPDRKVAAFVIDDRSDLVHGCQQHIPGLCECALFVGRGGGDWCQLAGPDRGGVDSPILELGVTLSRRSR